MLIKFYQTAYKATVQSSALLDLAGGNGIKQTEDVAEGRELLRRIAAMFPALSKSATRQQHPQPPPFLGYS